MARHTNVQLRERVVKLSQEGNTSRKIAELLSICKSSVNNILKKFSSGKGLKDLPRSGRPRKTTSRVDKIIKRKSVADVWKNASEIARELREENLADVSRSTVTRRLQAVGLTGRVGVKKPLISKKNKTTRMQFARKYASWTVSDWRKVLFSDESKFNLFGSDGRRYVRRPVGARDNPRYQIPTVKHGGGSVLVWGAFSGQGVAPLVHIDGVMNAVYYRNILETSMLPFAKTNMPSDWIFQHDRDPKHTSKLVTEWLIANKVNVLDWPAQSPDLNPIEHLWGQLGKQAGKQTHKNKAHLLRTLKEEWLKIPRDYINTLIESMPRRCAAVIAAKGMSTKY